MHPPSVTSAESSQSTDMLFSLSNNHLALLSMTCWCPWLVLETPIRSFDTGKPACTAVRIHSDSSYTVKRFDAVSFEGVLGGLRFTTNVC